MTTDELVEHLKLRGRAGDMLAAAAAVEMDRLDREARKLRHDLAKCRVELAQVYNTRSVPCAFCPQK